MPIHHLDKLFYPCSVAVVGATNQDNEAGNLVMHNLLQGGFKGPIMPVTDREQAIAGVREKSIANSNRGRLTWAVTFSVKSFGVRVLRASSMRMT